jgi:hypothetical protein
MREDAPMKMSILATNDTDRTVSVSIDGKLYEYWLTGDHKKFIQELNKLLLVGAHGKALSLLKRRAYKCDKLG